MKKTTKKTKPARLGLNRSRVEPSLRNSELRYRRLFEAAQDGILILDAKTGAITDVNPYLIDKLGYSREEFIEKKLWQVGAFKDIEASKDAFEALQKNEYIRYKDLPLKAKDGRLIQVEFVSNVYLVGEDKVIQCNIRDITARKQAEAALRESEERYHLLFENNPHPMWVYDLKTLTFLTVNDAAIEKYGYTREEFLRMTIADIRPMKDVPRLMDQVARQRPTLQHAGEWRHRLKNGTVIDVEVTSHTLRMDEHDAVLVVAHDITARKQAEQEIASLAKFPSENPNPVLRLSRDGIVMYANTTSGALLGMWGCAVGGSAPQFWRDLAAQALASRENKTVEVECDGKVYSMFVTPVAEPGYVNLYGRDITARKQVEGTLRDSEKRFRALIENSSDAIALISAEGKIIYRSPAAYRLMGLDPAALRDDSMFGAVHPDDVKEAMKCFAQVLQTPGKPILFQYRIQHLDGSWRWVEGTGANLLAELAVHAVVVNYRDITERKRAEARIAYQANLLAQVSDSIAASDEQFRLTFWNTASEAMYGWKAEQVLGRNGLEIVRTEWPAADSEGMRRTIAETGRLHGEATQQRKDGTRFPVEISSLVLHDDSGQITGYVSVNRDITERKRAEEALHASEERFRSILDNIEDGVYEVDTAGNLTFSNPAHVRMLGRPANELMGMNNRLYMTPEGATAVFQTFNRVFRTGVPEQAFDWEVVRPDGTRRSVEVSVSLIKAADGSIKGFRGTMRDITERKRAEETLHDSREELYRLLNSIAEGAYGVDTNGNCTFVNRAFLQILGYPNDHEVLGKHIHELIHHSHSDGSPYPSSECRMYRAHQTNQPINVTDEVFWRKDGVAIPVEYWSHPIVKDGVVIGSIATFVDITERKRAEEEIHRRAAEFAALYETTRDLSTQYELPALLQSLADNTVKLLKSDSAAIYLYDSASDELALTVESGFQYPVGARLRMGEGMAGRIAQSREPQIIDDYQTWESRSSKHEGIPFRAVAEVPMLYRGNLIGVLSVAELGESSRKYSEADLQLLSLFASPAASAVHNARLHEETVRQLDRLEALHKIDIAISASMDLRMTLNVLLEHVKTQLKADATDVLLYNPRLHTLDFAAGHGFRTKAIERTHLRLGESHAGRAALERHLVHITNLKDAPELILTKDLADEGFVSYYAVPLIAKGQVKGVLEIFHRVRLNPDEEWLNFLQTLAGQAAIAVESAQLFENLQRSNADLALAYDATIEGWSRALDLRDKETEGHTQRVTEITLRLAKAMGIGDAELVHVRRGALLHDIGKMGVPDNILLKPGTLTDEEWVVMRKHPQLAYDMLSPIAYLHAALDIPYCHHEKWDGTGYPRGLQGEQIPLAARLFAVVDVWDALRSDRPYRAAWAEDKVLEHIRSLAGTHFDPQAVKVCLESGVLGTQAPE